MREATWQLSEEYLPIVVTGCYCGITCDFIMILWFSTQADEVFNQNMCPMNTDFTIPELE